MVESAITIVQSLGFPIACVIACAYFIYYIVKRDKDEAKERENKLMENSNKVADAVDKVADAVKVSNDTNVALLGEVKNQLADVNANVNKVLDKLN